MADITSQLDSVRNADSFTSLKEAIYETLDAISKAGIENDAIKDIQRTLTSLNKKIDEMDDSDDSLRTDITRLKDVIGSINKLVNSKADSKTLDQFKTDVDKKNSEFETAILQKADKNTVNQIEKDLSGKADADAVSEELSKKADISTINTIEKELSEKMDAESIASVLSSKADISTVNTIEKELSDKVSTESFANALSGKADAEDINKLLSSPVMGIRVASAPGNVTTLKLNAPAYSGSKAITRGGDDTNFTDGEDDGSDLPENVGDGGVDQTGGSSGDTGGTGSIDSTTELVALSYLNTVVGNLNQEINGKVDQHTFDEIVGDGFNTWTITDYIIRLREDWNTALNGMLTKQYADEVAHDAAETLSSIIMIDESPTEETKLSLEFTEEDVVLVEKSEFDAFSNEYNQLFTFNWKGEFELGCVDEHGWKAEATDCARSVDLLGARDFVCTLNSKYTMEVVSYDYYKLYIDTTLPMSGEVSYNLYDHSGAEYIRILVKNYDGSDISDVSEIAEDITITMFGTDWTGENSNKPVDVSVVDKVKVRVSSIEADNVLCEERISTLESNQETISDDIVDICNDIYNLKGDLKNLSKYYLSTQEVSVDWVQGGIYTTSGSDFSSTDWIRTGFIYAYSSKIRFTIPSGLILRIHEFNENLEWQKATDKNSSHTDFTLTYPYFRFALKFSTTATINPSDGSGFTMMEDSQIYKNKTDIEAVTSDLASIDIECRQNTDSLTVIQKEHTGYNYLKFDAVSTGTFWNNYLIEEIPTGTILKFKYGGYTGSKFIRAVYYGVKSDNTNTALYSLYTNTPGDTFEVVTVEPYIKIGIQLILSESESNVSVSLWIKGDYGNGLGNDIISLQQTVENNVSDIFFIDTNLNQLVNSHFNLFDLCTFEDGYIYNSSGAKVATANVSVATPIRVKANVPVYYKNVRLYFSYYLYDDGTNSGRIANADTTRYGQFTPSKDGYAYLTVNQKYKTDCVCTTDPVLYNSYRTVSFYTPKNLLIGDNAVIVVDKSGNGDYSSLIEAVEDATENENVTLIIRSGTYDIISEYNAKYGENYVDAHTFTSTDRGIELRNGVHLVFDTGAIVTCNYSGTNATFNEYFSPFNVSGSCEIENLNLTASNCRYAVHDENGGNSVPYHVRWRRCSIVFDNHANQNWLSKKVIGGGLGKYGDILIEDCYFDSVGIDTAGINSGIVTYHNPVAADAISKVVIRGCYFNISTFSIRWYGNSTLITECMCSNNSFTVAPWCGRENSSYNTENVVMYAWNNEVRS